jgi:hypothetical protein
MVQNVPRTLFCDVYVTLTAPEVSVVPLAALSEPQNPLAVKFTVSDGTAAPPTPLVTVAVIIEVATPSPLIVDGLAVRLMLLGTTVWVIVFVPANWAELLLPPFASVTVTTQVPAVVDAVYVTAALPVASVVAEAALRVPHALLGEPARVNATRSLAMSFPATVAVSVEVLAPSAGTLDGATATVIVLVAVPCWVMTTVVLLPVPASVAVMVQKPTVVLEE